MVTFENQNIEFKQEYVPDLRKEVMKYMERRGSGLRKIVSETEKLPGYTAAYKPEFSSTATDFRVILKNVNYIMCGASVHDAAHDTSVISKQNLLLEFCADPKSRDEMQAYIDVSRQTQKQKPEIHYRSFQITKKQGIGSHFPLSCFFSFQIIFASFTHTSNPELHILNPIPYPTARSQPAAAPSD